jgi:hypothetical protein
MSRICSVDSIGNLNRTAFAGSKFGGTPAPANTDVFVSVAPALVAAAAFFAARSIRRCCSVFLIGRFGLGGFGGNE